ncbi:head maturation protease [Thiohalocapsa phage LS06-2018-MD03]|nr:head maturation protease [Thiohalocapsa phage LS06-2018-MD03]
MNKHFLALVNEAFYASTDDMRAFFMMGVDLPESFLFDDVEEKTTAISNIGETHNTINITGMMLREQSWITDLGWATSTEQVIEGILSTIAEGKKVKLVFDTGGGLVSGTSNLADVISENKDNVDCYVKGMACSAGMWTFSAGGNKYAEPTSILGSIGVVTTVFDDEQYWQSHGIVWKEIVSENAKNKRPDVKTDEGKAEVKRYLTSLESVFIDSVCSNLDMTKEEVISNFHEGGLITGVEANEMGILTSLTSYNSSLATMPSSELSAEKIVTNSNTGDDVMPNEITQEQLDAVNSQLEAANVDLATALAEKEALQTSLDSANAKIDATKNIVGMAFDHNVSQTVAMEMVEAGDEGSAAKIALDSKKSNGSTSKIDDNGDGINGENQGTSEDEMAYAKELAKSFSVK